jgi:hypothetical protein
MTQKENKIQEALDDLWIRYGKTLSSLNDALDQLDKKPKEVIVEKEIEVEVEKIVEVERKVEVPKEVVVTREVEVPGPERIVEVPGPERIVERIVEVEVPGPERIVEKIVEVEVESSDNVREVVMPMANQQEQLYRDQIAKLKAHNQELINKLQTKPEIVEKESSKDLRRSAQFIANSELNKEGLSAKEIFELLQKYSEEELNKQLGFWAVPLPTKDDDNDDTEPRYFKK